MSYERTSRPGIQRSRKANTQHVVIVRKTDILLDGCWAHLPPSVRVRVASSSTDGKLERIGIPLNNGPRIGRREVLMSDISILLKISERAWIQIGEGAEYRNIQLSNTFYTYG